MIIGSNFIAHVWIFFVLLTQVMLIIIVVDEACFIVDLIVWQKDSEDTVHVGVYLYSKTIIASIKSNDP